MSVWSQAQQRPWTWLKGCDDYDDEMPWLVFKILLLLSGAIAVPDWIKHCWCIYFACIAQWCMWLCALFRQSPAQCETALVWFEYGKLTKAPLPLGIQPPPPPPTFSEYINCNTTFIHIYCCTGMNVIGKRGCVLASVTGLNNISLSRNIIVSSIHDFIQAISLYSKMLG